MQLTIVVSVKLIFLEMKVLKVKKEGEARPIPVPGNPNDDLAIGTLKSIFRQAGITDEDLKNY